MGLPRILIFSALTGISFSAAIGASSATGGFGGGLAFSELTLRYLDSSVQTLMVIVSTIFTIFFIFRLAKFFREILDNKITGVATAVLGFAGSCLIVLSPQDNSHVFVVGIGLWILGLFVVIVYRNKN